MSFSSLQGRFKSTRIFFPAGPGHEDHVPDKVSTDATVLSLRSTASNGRRFVILAILAVGAIVVLTAYSLVAIHRELTESALERRSAMSELAAATLAEKFGRAIDIGVSLATRVRFRNLIEAGQWTEAAAILRDAPDNFTFIERIGLFDLNGVLVADLPEISASPRPVLADRDWIIAVLRNGKPGISAIFRSPGTAGRKSFVVTVPIRSSGGAMMGVLAAKIPVEAFFSWLKNINVGENALVYVVDRAGAVAFHSRIPVGDDERRDYSAVPAVQRVLKGSRGVEIAFNPIEKEERLSAYSPIAGYGWGVVVAEPTGEVFETRNRLLAGAVAAFLLILMFSGAYASNRIAQQRARVEDERRLAAERERRAEENHRRVQQAMARQSERLRIQSVIDRAVVAEEPLRSIAEAAVLSLRDLLGVPRVIVNLFDRAAGEVEWLAAAGRRRLHAGAPVRYSIRLMGDLPALERGEPQVVNTRALPPGPEVDALLAAGVETYMVAPLIAGGELIGAISFGGEHADFSPEQVSIAQETAMQLAIAIMHTRLLDRVRLNARELERRVAERTQQLEASNKELESFSYSVSHDLRAPLRAVDGYAQMLAEDYGESLDDEGRRLIGVVRGSAEQMGRLIDDLLRFSQVGRRTLAQTRLDMRALVGEVVAELASSHPTARIELGPLPEANGDHALLRQVWSNLIGNALKYSARSSAPRIEISGRVDESMTVYSVRDNGAGFDMQYYEKLFNVFQRLHREDEFEGTGVGLAIVQRVVSRHGGRVWAEGTVGAGATFHFSIPLEIEL